MYVNDAIARKKRYYEHGWTCQSYQPRAAKKAETAVQAYVSVRTLSTLVVMLFSSGERDYGIEEGKEKIHIFLSFLSLALPYAHIRLQCSFQIDVALLLLTMKMMMINLILVKAQSRYSSFTQLREEVIANSTKRDSFKQV